MTPPKKKPSTGKPSAGKNPAGKKAAPRKAAAKKPSGRFKTTTKPAVKKAAPQQATRDVHDPGGVRLQKLLAAAGVGSRRASEELIAAGRVTVDGQVVTELGVRVDPDKQVVHVDGDRVQLDSSRVYLAFNKPLGVVSTMNDELGRDSVGQFVEQRKERLFHVGRLDADTEGLLLLTNDGELANRLQHPAYGVPKVYVATFRGQAPRDLGKTLRSGVELEDGLVKVDSFRVVDSTPGWSMVEVVLHEGRKHVVRRMLDAVGFPVESLVRTKVGDVQLGELRPGKLRPLTKTEVASLYRAAGL